MVRHLPHSGNCDFFINAYLNTKVVAPSSENKTAGGAYLSLAPQSSAPI